MTSTRMMRDRCLILCGLLIVTILSSCRSGQAENTTPVLPQTAAQTNTPAPVSTRTFTPEPSETATVTASIVVVASSTPLPTQTDTPPTCLERQGTIEEKDLNSNLMEDGLVYRVYTPPCYSTDLNHRYPVLYLIHGLGSTAEQWDRLGVDELADELVTAGEIPPVIIVLPQDDLGLRPTRDPFGESLITELIPEIDANYRTLATREYRALGGISRGGNWAVHLGFQNWELFGSIGGHSTPGFLIDGPAEMRAWLEAIPRTSMPRVYLDVGERDIWLEEVTQLESIVDEAGVPHEWYLFPGYHDEEYWGSHIEQYLRWYTAEW